MNNIPKVNIEKTDLSDNYFTTNGNNYDIPTIIQFCKEKAYPVFDMPLAGVNLSGMPWSINNLSDFIHHCNRTNNSELKYPIIFDAEGSICDGAHRICKAILNGDKTIKAIRMLEMPRASGECKSEE